jgi:hypothetical protein
LIGRVCSSEGRCLPCDSTFDCLEEPGGGYPARTLCIEGTCAEGDCQDSSECPEDLPICGDDYRCRACQEQAECLDKEGVLNGYVCDLVVGKCMPGDCYPPDSPCNAPQYGVCENYSCRACTNEGGGLVDDCQLNGYPGSVICTSDGCVAAECNDIIPCTFGRVCQDNSCVDCNAEDDSYCTANGMTCNLENFTCVGCVDDSQCSEGHRICENSSCRDCLPGECGPGRVCAGGGCFDGDCWIDGEIWTNSQTKPDDPCSKCDRLVTQFAWSANPNVPCDDDIDCTYGDACSTTFAGVCSGQSYSCPSKACADPVCDGRGPAYCTLEKKIGWAGCFIDNECYAISETNEMNSCQYCAGQDEWSNKPLGTGCGNCMTCQEFGQSVACGFVEDGQDTNNDCLEVCQVCNGFGGCRWVSAGQADPNPNACPASSPTECGYNGLCLGNGPDCAFWTDVADVSDGNECTINDACNGAGGITGDQVTDGTLCNTTKVCYDGVCRDCVESTFDCPNDPINMVCVDSNCTVGVCSSADDCGSPPECKVWTCVDNQCVEQNSSEGFCDDDNPCTLNDYCLNGICQPGTGSPNCTAQDDQCNTGVCVPLNPDTLSCEKDPLDAGTSCEADGLACTVDECNGGGEKPGLCRFSSIVAGLCFIDGICYDNNDLSASGCGICQAAINQTEWQSVAPATPCGISACDEVCVGQNCLSRWHTFAYGCFTNDEAEVRGMHPCVEDRVTGKRYFYRGNCSSSCTCDKTRAAAEAACDSMGLRLPTMAEYMELNGTIGCTADDCRDEPHTMGIDPILTGKTKSGWHYWTSEHLGGNLYKVAHLTNVGFVEVAFDDTLIWVKGFYCIQD